MHWEAARTNYLETLKTANPFMPYILVIQTNHSKCKPPNHLAPPVCTFPYGFIFLPESISHYSPPSKICAFWDFKNNSTTSSISSLIFPPVSCLNWKPGISRTVVPCIPPKWRLIIPSLKIDKWGSCASFPNAVPEIILLLSYKASDWLRVYPFLLSVSLLCSPKVSWNDIDRNCLSLINDVHVRCMIFLFILKSHHKSGNIQYLYEWFIQCSNLQSFFGSNNDNLHSLATP